MAAIGGAGGHDAQKLSLKPKGLTIVKGDIQPIFAAVEG
jgi:hypothetical protein